MKNYLVLSALGEDRSGLVNELSKVIQECGCHIADTRMTVLGREFAIIMMVHGNWNTLAKLEVQLKRLEHISGLTIVSKRTEGRKHQRDTLPYAVEVISIDQSDVIHNLASFFSTHSINIEDMLTRSYQAAHTGTPMLCINLAVGIPANTHIATLREEFMDFCDELNLDAIMEPVKG